MRQLVQTGWMHNRARMITASFLVKDLLIDWRWGEHFFMQHLLDADPAANNGGWQWTAGVGTDAAPYFRIFNPVLQGEKFDPEGLYVREWVPELARVPQKYLHAPWTMPADVQRAVQHDRGPRLPPPDRRSRASPGTNTAGLQSASWLVGVKRRRVSTVSRTLPAGGMCLIPCIEGGGHTTAALGIATLRSAPPPPASRPAQSPAPTGRGRCCPPPARDRGRGEAPRP